MTHYWQKIIIISLIIGIILLIPTMVVVPGMASVTNDKLLDNFSIYLPITMNKYPLWTVFGVTLDKIDSASGLDQFAEAGMTWTRRGLNWSSIEPVEGQRIWDSSLDLEIINAANHGITPIMIIESTPHWALKDGYNCGAVKQEKFNALGAFAYDLVKRYSVSPYNVHYWELWNEPDAAGILGCWGDPNDPNYYGGYYYGQMLQIVYPMIKAADPQAQVLVGGLLLDCDPVNPPVGKDCTPSKFLIGVLKSGSGNSFDGVAFHGYDVYEGLGKYNFRNWHSASYASDDPNINIIGPLSIAKGRYLKQVLAQYGVGSKYLMNTETGIIYGPNQMTPLCSADADTLPNVEATKVYYLIHSYTSAIAEGYKANIWYSAIGGRCTGLLNEDLSAKPAYEAYKFAYQKLRDVVFLRTLANDEIMGYEYQMGNRKLWVIWTIDGEDHPITLPKEPVLINKVGPDGIAVQIANTVSLTVGLSPYFIEFSN